jgi:hypothetical protein
MGRQPTTLPDAGAARNPNQSIDERYLSVEQASAYLREKHKLDISVATLNARRSYGKNPAFVRIGPLVRYSKNDLDLFARQVGLSAKGFDAPKHEGRMTATERAARAAAANGKK